MEKKKEVKLEDIIPSDVLENISKIYHILKKTRALNLKDYEHTLKRCNKLMEPFIKERDNGLIDDDFTDAMIDLIDREVVSKNLHKLQEKGDYQLLSQIETVFYDAKISMFKSKTSGGLNEFEMDFLLLALIEELIKYTNKPAYRILEDYLFRNDILKDTTYDRLAKKYERAKKIKPHIIDILETYFSHTAKKLTLLRNK